jgi:hypothetical protein
METKQLFNDSWASILGSWEGGLGTEFFPTISMAILITRS